jgi:NAD(P)-dependent dehydrogenase (short-subunit alcohol dehydrogenase family)
MSDLFDVSGKTALVTGGSRGIGFMIARGLAQAGVKLVIASRKQQELEAAGKELREIGEVEAVPADLSTPEGAAGLANLVGDRFGALSILVNNAGVSWGAPLEEFPASGWDRAMHTNVEGVFHLTVGLLPALRTAASAEDPARVINIGSIDGIHVPAMETYAYSASKAAVHQLTRHLAKALAPRVTVNAIAPGPFESKMMHATLEAFGDQIAASAPMRRIGRPDDMAGAAIYLASPAASYVTGAVLPVDGGIATLA